MLIRLARHSSLLAAVLALGSSTLPRTAHAWVDARVAGDDVRVDVAKDGSARVEHKITLKISGGPLRALDLRGVDSDAVPETDGYVIPSKDAASGSLAQAEPVSFEMLPPSNKVQEDGSKEPSILRVRFDADKGLSRGVFVVFVRYRTELFRRGLIHRDGSMAQLRWSGLSWNDGFDSARATFILPSGPTEPRPDEAPPQDPGAAADAPRASTLSTLRRVTGRDELELLRPYAPKGESVAWHVRFDARALDVTAGKTTVDNAEAPAAPSSVTPARRDLLLVGAGLVFVLYSLLVALKSREVLRTTAAAGAEARPLIPLPMYVRSVAAGLALVAGLTCELFLRTGTIGAMFVALAAAFSMHRTPTVPSASRLRGPGTWLPISEEEAFARLPRRTGTWIDSSTRAGKALLFATLVLLGVGIYFISERSVYHAYLLGFDSVAIFALFCTGRLSDVPLDAVSYAKPFLSDVAKRLRKAAKKSGDDIRLIPRIRLPEGSATPDELRLAIVPRSPLTGFVGLEVGVVAAPSAESAVHMPELILRVTAGSPCETGLAGVLDQGKSQRGRRSSERAITFMPRLPTTWLTADLALRLVSALREARKSEERSGIRRTSQLDVDRVARVA